MLLDKVSHANCTFFAAMLTAVIIRKLLFLEGREKEGPGISKPPFTHQSLHMDMTMFWPQIILFRRRDGE